MYTYQVSMGVSAAMAVVKRDDARDPVTHIRGDVFAVGKRACHVLDSLGSLVRELQFVLRRVKGSRLVLALICPPGFVDLAPIETKSIYWERER